MQEFIKHLYKYWKWYSTIPLINIDIDLLYEFVSYGLKTIDTENGSWRVEIEKVFGWNVENLQNKLINFALLLHIVYRIKMKNPDIDFIYLTSDVILAEDEKYLVDRINTNFHLHYPYKICISENLYSNRIFGKMIPCSNEYINAAFKLEAMKRYDICRTLTNDWDQCESLCE